MVKSVENPFEKPLDEEDAVNKIEPLFSLISEKKDYLEAQIERDKLTFGLGFTINYTLMFNIVTYIGIVGYTIYEQVMS